MHFGERDLSDPLTKSCTAFAGQSLLFSGPLAEVAIAVARSAETADAVLVFDDAEILERLSNPPKQFVGLYRPKADETSSAGTPEDGQRGRGRPELGVVAREVTLLPRQWEWLATQSGGASATLRRLVDDARKAVHPRQQRRAAQEAGRMFVQRGFAGRVVMLNLLKFKDVADCSGHPELAPAMPIGGAQVVDRYVQHTLPSVRESGTMSCCSARAGRS